MSPGPVASSPDSGRQSQSARGAVAGNPAGAVATSPSHQARQVTCEHSLCCIHVLLVCMSMQNLGSIELNAFASRNFMIF